MKNSTGVLSLLIGVLACFATGQVFADAVVTGVIREVHTEVGFFTNADSNFNTSGPFLAGLGLNPPSGEFAFARQNSSIGVLQFEGTGAADITSGTAGLDAEARSLYGVLFDLSVSHAYSLSGSLEEFVDGGESTARFSLIGSGTSIVFNAIENAGALAFADSGVLGPGSYTLVAQGRSIGHENTNYFVRTDWEFDLTLRMLQVPEPTTLALLGIGLAGLGFRRRKRIARSPQAAQPQVKLIMLFIRRGVLSRGPY